MSRLSSRRKFVLGSLGLGAASVLAACQQAPASPQVVEVEKVVTQVVERERIVEKPVERVVTQVVERQVQVTPVAQPARNAAKAQIVFWGHENHPIDNAIPGYQEKYPNVTVKAEHLGDWLVKFRATLASGTDVPDLVWLEEAVIQDLGNKGVLLDTTEIVAPQKDKLAKAKLAASFIAKKGRYFAVPGDIGLVGLWYRQDLYEKAGIKELPKDLKIDDFVSMSQQVQKETGAAAFLFPKSGWNWPFQAMLSQNGGTVADAAGEKVLIDDEKGVEAMEHVKKLWDAKAGLDADWLKPPYWAAVKGNKLASDYSTAWMRGFVAGELKSEAEGLNQWRLAPLPALPKGIARTAQIGGACLASTKFTKNPEAVLAFQEYAFISMDGANAVGSWGIIPSYLPYLESTLFQNQKSPVFGDFQYGKVWTELAKELSPTYVRTAVFSEAMTAVTQNMMPIMRGEVSVKDGMKKIGDLTRQANSRYQ